MRRRAPAALLPARARVRVRARALRRERRQVAGGSTCRWPKVPYGAWRHADTLLLRSVETALEAGPCSDSGRVKCGGSRGSGPGARGLCGPRARARARRTGPSRGIRPARDQLGGQSRARAVVPAPDSAGHGEPRLAARTRRGRGLLGVVVRTVPPLVPVARDAARAIRRQGAHHRRDQPRQEARGRGPVPRRVARAVHGGVRPLGQDRGVLSR